MVTFKKLLNLFDKKVKRKLITLFFMMIIAALFETVGIGVIVPFVSIVTNPKTIQEQVFLSNIYDLFGFQSTNAFIIFSVVMLLLIFIFKNLYIFIFNYVQVRITMNQQVKLSQNLFKVYLTKPYSFHLQNNTADLLRNVNNEVSKVFNWIINSGFQLFTEILVICCILILLIATAPVATITASILLGGSVLLFFRINNRKLGEVAKEQQKISSAKIKWVNQGLGASKEIKVSGKEDFFIKSYSVQSQAEAKNTVFFSMLQLAPRLFVETILVAIVLITMLVIIFQETNFTQVISTMALFAMAAFRLMPSINRVTSLVTNIRYNLPALDVIYEDLILYKDDIYKSKDKLVPFDSGEKVFKDSIQLKNLYYCYPNQKDCVIKDVSLTISIGQSVAFIGESGAGKSTLVDIILGLFCPKEGEILIDGQSLITQKDLWQQKIGYIPQSIFLSDDTIRANVAFGIDSNQINDKEVWRALEQAQLKDFVEELPDKLDTTVGEWGVRLSGGQRQRIGIARALYPNPEILFMDEATSALDNLTETEIMKAIDGLKGQKTLIIIAHRLSTIENCDVVYKISKGRLVAVEKMHERSIM